MKKKLKIACIFKVRTYLHMKVTSPKNTTTSNSPSSLPFFNKGGEGIFFSKTQEVESPFFDPPIIQPKLTIGQPNDKFEKEADSMAEEVVQKLHTPNSSALVQSKCEDCAEEEKLQKMEQNGDEEMKRSRKPIFESEDTSDNDFIQENRGEAIEAGTSIETQLRHHKGTGQPLHDRTRANMEGHFGVDFKGIKVHTGDYAVRMNQELGAHAFTNGNDIYFNHGNYNPNTKNGDKLLAHELTHVVQQNGHKTQKPETEMIPGFSNQNQVQSLSHISPMIQCDKIDHRDLTWDDFKGKVPKKSSYSASTYSNFTELALKDYPFKPLEEVETGTSFTVDEKEKDCTKGIEKDKNADKHPEKYKAFKVNIEPDMDKLEVKSYMWQEKSWVKPLSAGEEKAMEAKINSISASCEKAIKKQMKKNEADCKKNKEIKESCTDLAKDCVETLKDPETASYNWEDLEITEIKNCNKVLKPECLKRSIKSCIDDATQIFTYNSPGVSAEAESVEDCHSDAFKKEAKAVQEDLNNILLSHEQHHFNITNELANQLTERLRAVAGAFEIKEVEACSKGKALKAAKKVVTQQKKVLSTEIKSFKSKWDKFQKTYDSETKHGTINEAQNWWEANIVHHGKNR